MNQVCPHCGKVSTEESSRFCSGCGARMDGKSMVGYPIPAGYGAPVEEQKIPIGYPGYAGYATPVRGQKSQLIAGTCSTFLPGLGQVYNGETAKGFAIFIIISGMALLSIFIPNQSDSGGNASGFVLVTGILGLVTFIVPGIVWLYAMYNAYSTAGKMNRGEIPFREMQMLHAILFVVFALAVIVVGIVLISIMFLGPLMSQFGSLGTGNINQLMNTGGLI